MPRLIWDQAGERHFQAGVDRGVLYVKNRPGVVWNGLTSVSENNTGGEVKSYYLDGVKYAQYSSIEEYEGTIEAFMYPPEFERCNGEAVIYSGFHAMQQRRESFGLSYRVRVGNDLDGPESGYRIHIIYNAIAEPASVTNETFSDAADPVKFNWSIKAMPPSAITSFRRTAHFVIDSRRANEGALAAIEDILYGTSSELPRLPTVAELVAVFEANSTFVIVDHGDGTFTASGDDDEVFATEDTIYELSSAGVVQTDPDTYTLTSP